MSVEFLLKSGTRRVALRAESASLFTNVGPQKSLVEQFREKVQPHTDTAHQQAANAKAEIERMRRSSDSSWIAAVVVALVVIALVSIVLGK